MSPFATAATAFVLILASTIAGALLRSRLPEHHLTGDSKDVIKLATALIATMSALVLALLFASTRASYERTSTNVSRLTADIVELDRLLDEYGPEAKPVQAALRAEIGPMIDSIWREEASARGARGTQAVHSPQPAGDAVLRRLRGLAPQNPTQSAIQARALQVGTDLAETRLILFTQPVDTISLPFTVVLVVWLMFIFGVFSMSAPPNATLITVLGICVLSASGAIYLILELGMPFDGLMQVSNEALRTALK